MLEDLIINVKREKAYNAVLRAIHEGGSDVDICRMIR